MLTDVFRTDCISSRCHQRRESKLALTDMVIYKCHRTTWRYIQKNNKTRLNYCYRQSRFESGERIGESRIDLWSRSTQEVANSADALDPEENVSPEGASVSLQECRTERLTLQHSIQILPAAEVCTSFKNQGLIEGVRRIAAVPVEEYSHLSSRFPSMYD